MTCHPKTSKVRSPLATNGSWAARATASCSVDALSTVRPAPGATPGPEVSGPDATTCPAASSPSIHSRWTSRAASTSAAVTPPQGVHRTTQSCAPSIAERSTGIGHLLAPHSKTVCTFAQRRQDSGQDVYAVEVPWNNAAYGTFGSPHPRDRAPGPPRGPAGDSPPAHLPARMHPRRAHPAGHEAVAGGARRAARREQDAAARGAADAPGGGLRRVRAEPADARGRARPGRARRDRK